MSKADEMFEELGYKKEVIKERKYTRYQYKKQEFNGKHIRTFDFCIFYEHKRVQVWGNMIIGIKEHLAIHEKMKELGWLNEQG